MCLAVFTVNVDTTIVNVTLPTLVAELGATTRDLQWIVDSYLLVFAALVLAGGSLSDRYGRRLVLLLGLAVFGLGNAVAAFADTPEQLIAARAFTGIGAAAVFPTTLSILTQVFRDRRSRAKAIGLWGASTGLAVAFGPITGGALLEQFWWGSTFLVKLPIALVAIVLVLALVPESKDPAAPRVDVRGIVLSALGLGMLVYTIIEAPGPRLDVRAHAGRVRAGGGAVRGVRPARATDAPADARPAAVRRPAVHRCRPGDHGRLLRAVRLHLPDHAVLPVPARLQPAGDRPADPAGGALRRPRLDRGTLLVVRLGNKLVVTSGLVSLGIAYAWVSTASGATSYTEIAGQMVFLGLGMGLTSAPATESIMGAVQTDQAGIGSAVNDATREVGGTLGVAVIGSVFASLYASQVEGLRAVLPRGLADLAGESVGAAFTVAAQLPEGPAGAVRAAAERGFFDGLQAGCLVASGVALAGAVVAAVALPSRPAAPPDDEPAAAADDAVLSDAS
jgi:predicted MFS family arabinose efflux permease